jgi:hypothetical protein
MCLPINLGCWRGLGGGGGHLAPQRNPDLQGSCSIATFSVYRTGVNKIPPKFDTLFANPFIRHSAV